MLTRLAHCGKENDSLLLDKLWIYISTTTTPLLYLLIGRKGKKGNDNFYSVMWF